MDILKSAVEVMVSHVKTQPRTHRMKSDCVTEERPTYCWVLFCFSHLQLIRYSIIHFLIAIQSLLPLYGQSKMFAIEGKILSQADSVPVSNSHVYISTSSIGTISNENGGFKIHVPRRFLNDTLTVSSVGFKNLLIPIDSIKNPLTYYLLPEVTSLPEITITPHDALGIIKKAVSKFSDNYSQKKMLYDIYYRETLKINSKYFRYIEVSGELVDKGFNNVASGIKDYKRATIKAKRINHSIDSAYKSRNGLFVVYWLNWAKGLLTQHALNNYYFEFHGTTTYDNNPVTIISIKRPDNMIRNLVYVNDNDFAIILIKSTLDNEVQIKPKDRENWWFLRLDLHVDFRSTNNGWFINSISDYRKEMNANGQVREAHRTINVVDIRSELKLSSPHKLEVETDLFAYPIQYDSAFWNSYNVPLDSDEQMRIRKMISAPH